MILKISYKKYFFLRKKIKRKFRKISLILFCLSFYQYKAATKLSVARHSSPPPPPTPTPTVTPNSSKVSAKAQKRQLNQRLSMR